MRSETTGTCCCRSLFSFISCSLATRAVRGRVGLALTALLLISLTIAGQIREQTIRVTFWIILGLLAAASLWMSVVFVLVLLGALVLWSAFNQRGRETLIACREALADGARQALSVGLACAVVGIVIGTMTLTGLGTIFGTWLISIGKESLFLALFLTMIFSLLLGMGIPTIPNYIITSSLAAPILLKLDVPLIVSHMFVFYFGIMADLTPPVALAAFAAAPMARVTGFQVANKAVLIALPGFIIPYMAVYDPVLMLQPHQGLEGLAYWTAALYVIGKAALALCLWGIAAFGHCAGPVSLIGRAWAFGSASFLVVAVSWTDYIGSPVRLYSLSLISWRREREQSPPNARPHEHDLPCRRQRGCETRRRHHAFLDALRRKGEVGRRLARAPGQFTSPNRACRALALAWKFRKARSSRASPIVIARISRRRRKWCCGAPVPPRTGMSVRTAYANR